MCVAACCILVEVEKGVRIFVAHTAIEHCVEHRVYNKFDYCCHDAVGPIVVADNSVARGCQWCFSYPECVALTDGSVDRVVNNTGTWHKNADCCVVCACVGIGTHHGRQGHVIPSWLEIVHGVLVVACATVTEIPISAAAFHGCRHGVERVGGDDAAVVELYRYQAVVGVNHLIFKVGVWICIADDDGFLEIAVRIADGSRKVGPAFVCPVLARCECPTG